MNDINFALITILKYTGLIFTAMWIKNVLNMSKFSSRNPLNTITTQALRTLSDIVQLAMIRKNSKHSLVETVQGSAIVFLTLVCILKNEYMENADANTFWITTTIFISITLMYQSYCDRLNFTVNGKSEASNTYYLILGFVLVMGTGVAVGYSDFGNGYLSMYEILILFVLAFKAMRFKNAKASELTPSFIKNNFIIGVVYLIITAYSEKVQVSNYKIPNFSITFITLMVVTIMIVLERSSLTNKINNLQRNNIGTLTSMIIVLIIVRVALWV